MGGERDRAPVDVRIARLADAQHGVVTRAQLLALGLGPDAVDFRSRVGRLYRLHRGVYAVGHRRLSGEGRRLAAVLACGAGAVMSHIDAAAQWGLRGSGAGRVHITVPTSAGRRRREGIVVHRSQALRATEVTHHHGIPVTTPARTLLDIAGMLRPGPLERAVEQSLVLRLFDLAEVSAAIEKHPTRRGVATLGAIVARIHDEPSLTRSEAEGLFLDIVDTNAIERPAVNGRLQGVEVDFAWRARRLVVEIDGHRHHATRTAFERDRARDARLTAAGWRVVRFTYRQLVGSPEIVAATLLALLSASSPTGARSSPPRR